MRTITTIGAALALTLALAPSARADEHNRLTYLTFSAPVQVPGNVTLAPGTYTFKLADTETNRHIVQIFNKDDNKLITTAMSIPSERNEPVDDTLVTFSERAAGAPQAVKEWFYPGRSIGEEFLYSKQPKLMARAEQQQPPPTDQSDSATRQRRDASQAPPPAPAPSTGSRDVTRPQSDNPRPAPNATTPSTPDRTTRPAPAPNASADPDRTSTANRSLPQTASPIALVELLSGLSIAAGYGLRRLRKSR